MNRILILLFLSFLFECRPKEAYVSAERENWWLWTANWQPDGKQIVVGGTQDTLRIFSGTDYELLKNYPLKVTITKAKWHPNKNRLAIAMQGGISKSMILDLDTYKTTVLDSLDDFGARAIGWNSSGDLLAVGDYSGYLTIYDNSGEMVKRVNTNQKGLIGLDWHPYKNVIVVVGEKIALYDFNKDSLSSIIPRKEEVLMLCVAWHPEGELFVTGDYGDYEKDYPPLLQFWNKAGGKIKDIEKSQAEYRNIAWSSNGEILAAASDYVRLWTKNGELIREEKSEFLLWGIDWNNDNSKIVTSDEKGQIVVWDENLNRIREIKY